MTVERVYDEDGNSAGSATLDGGPGADTLIRPSIPHAIRIKPDGDHGRLVLCGLICSNRGRAQE